MSWFYGAGLGRPSLGALGGTSGKPSAGLPEGLDPEIVPSPAAPTVSSYPAPDAWGDYGAALCAALAAVAEMGYSQFSSPASPRVLLSR